MSILRRIAISLGAAALALGMIGAAAESEGRDTGWPWATGDTP